jgi:hypothetical protein
LTFFHAFLLKLLWFGYCHVYLASSTKSEYTKTDEVQLDASLRSSTVPSLSPDEMSKKMTKVTEQETILK